MTREEIIEMLNWHPSHARTHGESGGLLSRIERVVAVAVSAEREACAKVCEQTTAAWTQHLYNEGVMDCVKAIRARGEK